VLKKNWLEFGNLIAKHHVLLTVEIVSEIDLENNLDDD